LEKNRLTFKREERLKSRKAITSLFESGELVWANPLKIVWKEAGPDLPCQVQAGFSVSSRNFRKSADRNLLKRRMREAFRKNKPAFCTALGEKKLILMFIYSAKQREAFSLIESSVFSGLRKINRRIRLSAG
jgi:ribonuclease P protein component